MTVQCQLCILPSSVPASYASGFTGPWRCPQCTARHSIVVSMGYVMSLTLMDEIGVPPGAFPRAVQTSLREMAHSFNAGAIRASVVMLRRALEAACVEKGGAGKTLAQRIADLGKRLALLDDIEVAQATATRLFGNYGAHPSDDGLDDLTAKDVRRAIELGVHLLQQLYLV